MTYDVGQSYAVTLPIVDANGVPANPATATLTITLPDQTTASPTVTLPPATQGLLLVNYVFAQAGLHAFDWATTNPTTHKTDYVNVRKFRSVVSLAETRDYLAISDTRNDEKIRGVMAGATRLAERIVGTLVIRQFTDEIIPGEFRDVMRLLHGPLVSTASVTSVSSVWNGGPVWQNSDLIVNPAAATLRLQSFLPFWFGPWKATYTGGRTEIPDDVILGVKEIIWDLWATQRGNLTDQQEPGLQEITSFEQSIPAGYRIPGRALELLEGERRPGFA
jgi:hypothetical protein